jgi:MerR family copper efflux transcriptional regulator
MDGLTIGQVAEAAGVTRKAVRTYEAKGLLPVPARSGSGYRVYDASSVELLAFIRRARTLGLRLDEIRDVLAVRDDGTRPCALVAELLGARITEIDRTVDELLALRTSLVQRRRRAVEGTEGEARFCSIIENREP